MKVTAEITTAPAVKDTAFTATAQRVKAVDLLRGAVMIIMPLDRARVLSP